MISHAEAEELHELLGKTLACFTDPEGTEPGEYTTEFLPEAETNLARARELAARLVADTEATDACIDCGGPVDLIDVNAYGPENGPGTPGGYCRPCELRSAPPFPTDATAYGMEAVVLTIIAGDTCAGCGADLLPPDAIKYRTTFPYYDGEVARIYEPDEKPTTWPSRPAVTKLTNGHLRVWAPDQAEGDLGIMYVLDVLGVSLLVRERDNDVYVHVDLDADSERPGEKAVTYEINNGGEQTLG